MIHGHLWISNGYPCMMQGYHRNSIYFLGGAVGSVMSCLPKPLPCEIHLTRYNAFGKRDKSKKHMCSTLAFLFNFQRFSKGIVSPECSKRCCRAILVSGKFVQLSVNPKTSSCLDFGVSCFTKPGWLRPTRLPNLPNEVYCLLSPVS